MRELEPTLKSQQNACDSLLTGKDGALGFYMGKK